MDNKISYPSEFVSSKEKLTRDWASRYFYAAWNEQLADDNFNLDARYKRFILNRKVAEGKDDITDIYKRFTGGDDTHIQVNRDVSTPLPKLARIAARTIFNRPFKPKVTPVDSQSVSKSNNRRNEMILKMHLEQMRLAMQEEGVSGIIPPQGENLPKDNDELEIHMLLNDKMAEVMAQEYLIRQGFMQNEFERVKRKLAKDLVVNKIAATRTYIDEDYNVRIKYVDPVRLISSFVEREDFEDARHIGEVVDVPISQLREMMQGEYDEQDLQWISEHATIGTRVDWRFGDPKYYNTVKDVKTYDSKKVKVVHLQVKQYDAHTYAKKRKQNGGFRIEEKGYGYKPAEDARVEREVIKKGAQVIYEGYWVVNTDFVFGWKRKEDLFRERINGKWFNTAKFDYAIFAPDMYDMINKSMIEEALFYRNELINIELKAQQLLIQADPPVTAYAVESLLSAMEGMGFGEMKPLDMVKISAAAGRYYYSVKNEMGEAINPHSRAIERLPSGIDNSLQILAEKYNNELEKMKNVLGIPDAVAGSEPDKKALVGIQRMAAAGHHASLSDLMFAYDTIIEETAKRVSLAFQTLIRGGKNVKEIEASLGSINVEEIKVNSLSEADFAVGIEMLPDEFEVEQINADLQQLAAAGAISPESKYTILRVAKESTVKAEAMMSVMAKKFRQEQEASKQQAIQLQTQGNAEVAQMTAQMEQQNLQLKYDLENRNEIAKLEKEKANNLIDWEEKIKFLLIETEQKSKLIEKASEEKDKGEEKKVEREEKGGGYNLKSDSIAKEAGKIEPSVFPSDLNQKQSIGVPTV